MSSMTTTDNKAFLNELARLVGSSHLLTDPAKTARYRKGFRSGQGDALAVVFPGSLLELWRVLKACVTADKIILMQAANTAARIASVCRFIAFIASSFRYAHRCCRNSTGLHTCDCHMAFFKGCGRRTFFLPFLWTTSLVSKRNLSTKNVLPVVGKQVIHKGWKIAGRKIVHPNPPFLLYNRRYGRRR